MSQENLKPWGPKEKAHWLEQQVVQRSYQDDVLKPLQALHGRDIKVAQYGALSHDPHSYPVMAAKVGQWSSDKQTIIITGGVHGYETSGVHGALKFLQTDAKDHAKKFNLLIAPCISPIAYGTINRWNVKTQDPNRGFTDKEHIEEAQLFMRYVRENFKDALDLGILAHIDLHEATLDDPERFEPEQFAKEGKIFVPAKHASIIPDGFFTIFDDRKYRSHKGSTSALGQAIIEAVGEVSKIAQPDHKGEIYGQTQKQEAVITTDLSTVLVLAFDPLHPTTTEQDGDRDLREDKVAENTNAQVVAVRASLDHFAANMG